MLHRPLRVRTRMRSDQTANLISIDIPEGLTDQEAADLFATFGLGDGYELVIDERGCKKVSKKRADEDDAEPTQTTSVTLPNGLTAHVKSSAMPAVEATSVVNIAVTAVRFDQTYSAADAAAWLENNQVDYLPGRVEQRADGIVALRSDNDAATKEIRVDEGVTVLVVPAAECDIPASLTSGVIETAYGRWGWGQLDFVAMMADREFSEAADDGISRLRSILDDILLYSDLPLDTRKLLASRACAQFATYIGVLIDNLPRGVLAAATRADKPTQTQEIVPMAATETAAASTLTDDQLEALADKIAKRMEPPKEPELTPEQKKLVDMETALAAMRADLDKTKADLAEATRIDSHTVVVDPPKNDPPPKAAQRGDSSFVGMFGHLKRP